MSKQDFLSELIGNLIKVFFSLFRNFYFGLKALTKNRKYRIIFILSFLFTAFAYLYKDKIQTLSKITYIQNALYYCTLIAPVLFVVMFGYFEFIQGKKYYEVFQSINFIGKDKKYPHLIGSKKISDKITVLKYKSNISLEEWKKSTAQLETALDCSIQKIEQGNNKKVVILTVVDSKYQIPENIHWKDEYLRDKAKIVVGETALEQIEFDLNRNAHVLVAGETGSGKSVILRGILWQLINKAAYVFMIDFKGGVEFGKRYEEFGEVIMDRQRALEVLKLLVEENQKRLALFRDLEVKNLEEFNNKTGKNLCRVGVIIDEIAEMLDRKGVSKRDKELMDEIESCLASLARLARATGINLIIGVQRPDANVLPGQIKNNVVIRISGRFADKTASEIVLNTSEACGLPEVKGRFIFKLGNETKIFQAYYFDDDIHLHSVDVKSGELLTSLNQKKEKSKMITRFEQIEQQNSQEINLDLDF